MQEKQIKIWTYNINYKEYWPEHDQAIVILHGWWWESDSWMQLGELLSNNNFKVIIPDLPWFWKTEIKSVFTLDDYALLIENFIKELKIDELILWWHSNWWAISIKIANRWKLDITRLVLNNSAWIRNDNKRSVKRKIFNSITKLIKKGIPKEWGGRILKSLRNLFYRFIWSQDYLKAERNPYLKQTYLNMISSDLTKDIAQIQINTLLLWGEKDTYTPLSDWLFMRKLIPHSKIVTIPDEKHGIHLQNPKLLISTFLKNI